MRLRDLYPQSALMESSDYHDKSNARSFIGIQPIASVAVGHGTATVSYPDGSVMEQKISLDYQTDKAINALLQCIKVKGSESEFCVSSDHPI